MKKYLLPAALLLASCSTTVSFKEDKPLAKNYSAFLQMADKNAPSDSAFPYKLVALPVGECRDAAPSSYTFTGSERQKLQRVYLQHKSGGVTQPVSSAEFYPLQTKTIIFSEKGISFEK